MPLFVQPNPIISAILLSSSYYHAETGYDIEGHISGILESADANPDYILKPEFKGGYLPWHQAALHGLVDVVLELHPAINGNINTPLPDLTIHPFANIRKVNNTLHFIWLGGQLPATYKRNIEGFQKIAEISGYKINLWMEDGKAAPEIAGAEIHRIDELQESIRRDHSDSGQTFNWAMQMEIQEQNWASASDLLRLEILRQSGGVYLDTDQMPNISTLGCLPSYKGIRQLEHFPSLDKIIPAGRENDFGVHVEMKCETRKRPLMPKIWKNDILASYAGNDVLRAYQQWALGNYQEYFALRAAGSPDLSLSLIHLKNTAVRGSHDHVTLTCLTTSFNKVVNEHKESVIYVGTNEVPLHPRHLDPSHDSDATWTKKTNISVEGGWVETVQTPANCKGSSCSIM